MMPASWGRPVRLGSAALFFVVAAVAITFSVAASLDAQGDDRLARLISGPRTQQSWVKLSKRMVTEKAQLDDVTIAALRKEAANAPLSAAPYFLTGASRKLQGDAPGGRRLVDIAILRDPRYLPPHYWQINDAAERENIGDATDAALRVIALDPESVVATVPLLVRLTRFRESWPKIRKALPTGLTWRETYFNQLVAAGFEPSIVFDAIDVARRTSGKLPTSLEQEQLLRAMAGKGDYERAYTAWIGWLPPEALARIDYLYDGKFTGAPGPAPFNWMLTSTGDASAAIDKDRGLRVDLSPESNVRIAEQTILLPPGKYRLTTVAGLDEPMKDGVAVPMEWHLTCLSKPSAVATLELPNSPAPKSVATIFDVPADCVAQSLALDGTAMEFPIRVGAIVRSITIEKAR